MCYSTIFKALRSPDVTLEFKASLAKDFAVRTIPNKVDDSDRDNRRIIYVVSDRNEASKLIDVTHSINNSSDEIVSPLDTTNSGLEGESINSNLAPYEES